MPTKTQAKTAVDNADTLVKADIDNILPVGVNIQDGSLAFNPTRWYFTLDAGGVQATADSWATTIATNLTNAARPNVTSRLGRRSDDNVAHAIIITSALATYKIINW